MVDLSTEESLWWILALKVSMVDLSTEKSLWWILALKRLYGGS